MTEYNRDEDTSLCLKYSSEREHRCYYNGAKSAVKAFISDENHRIECLQRIEKQRVDTLKRLGE
jgi:hypothetical protein